MIRRRYNHAQTLQRVHARQAQQKAHWCPPTWLSQKQVPRVARTRTLTVWTATWAGKGSWAPKQALNRKKVRLAAGQGRGLAQ